MSGKLMGEVFGLAVPRTEKRVLLVLCDHAFDDGTSARPGIPMLAWKAEMSERQVQRGLRALEKRGVVVPVKYARGGQGKATEYHIHLERAERRPPPEEDQTDRQDQDISTTYGDTQMSPFVHNESAITVTSETPKGDISTTYGDTQMSPHPSIHPSVFKDDDDEARAREEKIRPTAKTEFRHKPPGPPGPPGAVLADIEALVRDPLLLRLAEAAMDVCGQGLHTLTALQATALSEARLNWGERLTARDIAEASRKTKLNRDRITAPVAYLVSILDGWAVHGRASPGRAVSNGNGAGKGPRANGHAPPGELDLAKYTEPTGKYYHLFHQPVGRVIKTGGG